MVGSIVRVDDCTLIMLFYSTLLFPCTYLYISSRTQCHYISLFHKSISRWPDSPNPRYRHCRFTAKVLRPIYFFFFFFSHHDRAASPQCSTTPSRHHNPFIYQTAHYFYNQHLPTESWILTPIQFTLSIKPCLSIRLISTRLSRGIRPCEREFIQR